MQPKTGAPSEVPMSITKCRGKLVFGAIGTSCSTSSSVRRHFGCRGTGSIATSRARTITIHSSAIRTSRSKITSTTGHTGTWRFEGAAGRAAYTGGDTATSRSGNAAETTETT